MKTDTDLYQKLDAMGIAYTVHAHEPVFTVEEAAKVDAEIDGAHIKNLFLRDKKKTGLWLVTVMADVSVDLKQLAKTLGVKDRFSFCNEETLWDRLGVKPGSVTPLAVINDTENKVTAVLDVRVLDHELVNPHPLRNDRTVTIATEDLMRFYREVRGEPIVVEIPERIVEAA